MVYDRLAGPLRRAAIPFRMLCVGLALSAGCGAAQAQNIFELLFGPPPTQRRPPPPPPGPVPPANVGRSYAPPPGPGPREPEIGDPAAVRPPAGPVPSRPVLLVAPSEDSVVGRDLKLNGTAGTLRIDRSGSGMRALVSYAGSKISNPVEACTIAVSGGQPVNLVSEGRPENLARYRTDAAVCPLTFEILDGAVLVDSKTPVCEIAESDCKAEVAGLWGPDPATLIPRAKDFEQQRGTADKAVRENYKALTQRAQPQAVRPIVSEQAAFSAEREQICKSYAREGTHGFCNARVSEGRALVLASRLGMAITGAATTAARRSGRRSSPVAELPPDE